MKKEDLVEEIKIHIRNIEVMIENNYDIIKIKKEKKKLDKLLDDFYKNMN